MPPKRVGRPPRISAEMIEQAVIEVGFDQATTTAIAHHLGVEQSSLYRHITSREQLIAAAMGRVFAAHDWNPPADTWQDYIRTVAEQLWQTLEQHPGLASQMYAMTIMPPAMLEANKTVLHRLTDYGLPVRGALLLLDSIADMTGDAMHQMQTVHRDNLEGFAQQYTEKLEQSRAAGNKLEQAVFEEIVGALKQDRHRFWQDKVSLIIAGTEQLYT